MTEINAEKPPDPFDPFDFIDDDWIEAVVSVAAGLPDWKPGSDPSVRVAKKRAKRVKRTSKIKELAQQLRKDKA